MATRRALNPFLPILVLALIGLIWQVAVAADSSPVRIIPAPGDVWAAFVRNAHTLFTQHIPTTLTETLIGLTLALILGIALAAALDFSPLLHRALYPLLIISQTIPLIALAPVLLLIFGFGIAPKITVVVLFCIFPITIAMLDGLESTNAEYMTLMRSLGASWLQTWRKVRFPAALPALFSGLRIATTYSATGAIFGEYITAQQGLGQYMRLAYASAHTDQAFVAIVITALLSVGLVGLVMIVERLTLGWYFARMRSAQWNSDEIDPRDVLETLPGQQTRRSI